MKTLHHLFLGELADIYDAEHQIVKALPKFAKFATCKRLKELFRVNSSEAQDHIAKLEQIFSSFDRKAKAKTCEATVGLLLEGEEISADFADSPAINAALISVAQKVQHYGIASYGCLHAWALRLGNDEAADLLSEILEEKKATDVSYTKLALLRSNSEALDESGIEEFTGVGD